MLRLWADRKLPQWYYYLTGGATLLPAIKKNLGPENGEAPEVRPVAVGDVLRRTFERAVWRRSSPAITAALLPQQLGVGLPSGCQKQIWIAHLLQEMASLGTEDENWDLSRFASWVFVKLDQKNAHNS